MSTDVITPAISGEDTCPRPGFRATPAFVGRDESAFWRATQAGYHGWLDHIRTAAGCTRPVRLTGQLVTLEADTGRLLAQRDTDTMPDGVIYKPCGNRRGRVCPSCAEVYRADAFQLIRAGMIGGKGVPATVARHPAVFATFTAPSFGPVHTRNVQRHSCANRRRCDCRPEPCHARRTRPTCPHGRPLYCVARHAPDDSRLGQPLCLDCYDHVHQVVWNNQASELWRRTSEAVRKYLHRLARRRGIDPRRVRLAPAKVAEMQRRAVVHYHAIIRLDGANPLDPDLLLPPPPGLDVDDLVAAVNHATATAFTTDPHPAQPAGWRMTWGTQIEVRPVAVNADGEVTDSMVAGYLAKYATKSTETTGHLSARVTADTIDLYANPEGSHTERLTDACWTLGRHRDWHGLRRWTHMLGFGGHFLTKGRRYSVTFRLLRQERVIWARTQTHADADGASETTLVINFLSFAGAGWRTTGDALLANTAADQHRWRQQIAREEVTDTG